MTVIAEIRCDPGAARKVASIRAEVQRDQSSCRRTGQCSTGHRDGVPVVLPEVPGTTALGAALRAGVGAGLLTLDRVRTLGDERARHEPRMGEHRAVDRSRSE